MCVSVIQSLQQVRPWTTGRKRSGVSRHLQKRLFRVGENWDQGRGAQVRSQSDSYSNIYHCLLIWYSSCPGVLVSCGWPASSKCYLLFGTNPENLVMILKARRLASCLDSALAWMSLKSDLLLQVTRNLIRVKSYLDSLSYPESISRIFRVSEFTVYRILFGLFCSDLSISYCISSMFRRFAITLSTSNLKLCSSQIMCLYRKVRSRLQFSLGNLDSRGMCEETMSRHSSRPEGFSSSLFWAYSSSSFRTCCQTSRFFASVELRRKELNFWNSVKMVVHWS